MHAFSIAQQIEKQKEVSASNVEFTGESSVMAAQRMNRNVYQQKNSFNSFNQPKKDWKKEKNDKLCEHCKARGNTVDQCFKLIGYPEWYNVIKAGKKTGGSYNNHKIAANVQTNYGDSPLDFGVATCGSGVNNSGVNSEMFAAFSQQMMQSMKGKHIADSSDDANLSFAGNQSLLACSIVK